MWEIVEFWWKHSSRQAKIIPSIQKTANNVVTLLEQSRWKIKCYNDRLQNGDVGFEEFLAGLDSAKNIVIYSIEREVLPQSELFYIHSNGSEQYCRVEQFIRLTREQGLEDVGDLGTYCIQILWNTWLEVQMYDEDEEYISTLIDEKSLPDFHPETMMAEWDDWQNNWLYNCFLQIVNWEYVGQARSVIAERFLNPSETTVFDMLCHLQQQLAWEWVILSDEDHIDIIHTINDTDSTTTSISYPNLVKKLTEIIQFRRPIYKNLSEDKLLERYHTDTITPKLDAGKFHYDSD